MLRDVPGRKAVLLLTDGVDLASQRTLQDVIGEARSAGVPIYTLGVGEPGKNELVTTILALDQSGSMREPANDADRTPKIEALKVAASRFVDLMRPTAQTTLLPFHSELVNPRPFTTDRSDLKKRIGQLRPLRGTLLYDAAFAALETLEAAQLSGKKAVIVLTDGMDGSPGSRHSDRDVIARAREAGVPLHLLGLGRKGEINEEVMQRMAAETGGTYHHATNKEALNSIFEKLSIDLHDDGIDEASLRQLAEETGGKYYPARDVSRLAQIYQELAEELQSTYTATFASGRSSHDGTARGIDVSVVRHGARVSNVGSVDYATRGVVVPELDPRLYLVALAVLGVLLVAPSGLRGAWRKLAGG
jgi:VWFA-related protein